MSSETARDGTVLIEERNEVEQRLFVSGKANLLIFTTSFLDLDGLMGMNML